MPPSTFDKVLTKMVMTPIKKFVGIEENVSENMASEFKVLGAGFGRTGTTSTKEALETLGFQTYHMQDVILTPSHHQWLVDMFTASDSEKFDGAMAAWTKDALKMGYSATIDFPMSLLYKELMEVYPKAKVVFSTRDPESWYRSWHNLMKSTRAMLNRPDLSILFKIIGISGASGPQDKMFSDPVRGIPECVVSEIIYDPRIFWAKKVLDVKITDPEGCKKRIVDWEKQVLSVVPKEKLLQWGPKDGWKPLCDFLNVPLPRDASGNVLPVPNANSSTELEDIFARAAFAATYFWPGVLALLAILAMFFFSRRPSSFKKRKAD